MKDDSARDKAIEKLVAQKLRAGAATPSAACPDAEVLAAYFERTLAPKERATWEDHFSSCARCQAQLAALARMSSGEEGSPAAAPMRARVPARKIFRLRWAWAAPMLVAMFVAGLWYTGEFQPLLHQRSEIPRGISSPAPPAKPPEVAPANEGTKPAPLRAEKKEGAASALSSAEDKLQHLPRMTEQRLSNEPSPVPQPKGAPAAAPAATAETNRLEMAPAPPPKAIPQGALAGGNIAPPTERMQMEAPQTQREASAAGAGLAGGVASAPAAPLAAQPLREAISPQTEAQAVQLDSARLGPAGKASAGGLLGSVSGTVTDASGAAVPGATVTVRNTSTNVTTVLTANNAGAYAVAGLNPGVYTVRADARGFTPSVMNEVTLQAHADRKVDFALQVGTVAQTVEVQARAAAVQTASPPWRVGPRGLMQKLTPEKKWESKVSGVTADLFDIAFPNSKIGWAVGQGGTVLRSTNGGKSWSKLTSPTHEDLVHVTAIGAESATVSSRSGRFFSTDDGGRTWTPVASPK
jgi:hypothetical protein